MTFMMSQANDKNVVDSKMKKPKTRMAKPAKVPATESTAMTKKMLMSKGQKVAAKKPASPKPKNVTNKSVSAAVPTMLAKAKYN